MKQEIWHLSLQFSKNNSFLTWKQLKLVGGSVNKGEQGHIVIFWKKLDPKDQNQSAEESKAKSVLRYTKSSTCNNAQVFRNISFLKRPKRNFQVLRNVTE